MRAGFSGYGLFLIGTNVTMAIRIISAGNAAWGPDGTAAGAGIRRLVATTSRFRSKTVFGGPRGRVSRKLPPAKFVSQLRQPPKPDVIEMPSMPANARSADPVARAGAQ